MNAPVTNPAAPEPVPPPPAVSALAATLERIWRRIREHHPEVPDAVVVLGASTERGRSVTLGHFSVARWVQKDKSGKTRKAEVMIAAELFQDLRDVLEVLLHEAAHGLAHTRKIKDCSRQGRYHNENYKAVAEEVGLFVMKTKTFGFSETKLSPAAEQRYAAELAELAAIHAETGNVRRIGRGLQRPLPGDEGDEGDEGEGGEGSEGSEGKGEKKGKGKVSMRCACEPPLTILLNHGQADRHPITCGGCNTVFRRKDEAKAKDDAKDDAKDANDEAKNDAKDDAKDDDDANDA